MGGKPKTGLRCKMGRRSWWTKQTWGEEREQGRKARWPISATTSRAGPEITGQSVKTSTLWNHTIERIAKHVLLTRKALAVYKVFASPLKFMATRIKSYIKWMPWQFRIKQPILFIIDSIEEIAAEKWNPLKLIWNLWTLIPSLKGGAKTIIITQ